MLKKSVKKQVTTATVLMNIFQQQIEIISFRSLKTALCATYMFAYFF